MEHHRPQWWRQLWLVWGAIFAMHVGFNLIVPFLPLYVKQLGATGASVELWSGAILSAYFLMAAISVPFWGRISDRVGRRFTMIRSAVMLGIVAALMGYATEPWHLLALRLLQGISVGFIPAAIAYITSVTPKERAGYVLGTVQTAGIAGTIFGPFLGGLLASVMGFRPIFLLTGLSCFASAAIAFFFLRERITASGKPDRSTGLTADFRTVGANPALLSMVVVVLVQQFSVMTAEPIIPLYLESLHVPPSLLELLSGAVFSVVGVAGMLAAPFLGRRGDRIGYRKILMISLAGAALTYGLQGAVANWWQLGLVRFVQGAFVGGITASAHALISVSAPADFQGRAFSVSQSATHLGNFLGPLMGGAVATGFGYRAVFPVTALLGVLNLAWVYWGQRRASS